MREDELECSFKQVTVSNDTWSKNGNGFAAYYRRYSLSYSGQKAEMKEREGVSKENAAFC